MSRTFECANCGCAVREGEGELMMTASHRGYIVCSPCAKTPDLREGDLLPEATPVIEL